MAKRGFGWALVIAQFVLLAVGILLPWQRNSLALALGGGIVVALGVVLLLAAFLRLGDALTPTPVPKVGATLRTTGAYRLVRHPIYAAILLIVIGLSLAAGSPLSIAWIAALVAFFLLKSRWEDRLLLAAYPDEWPAWRARTPALVPRVDSLLSPLLRRRTRARTPASRDA